MASFVLSTLYTLECFLNCNFCFLYQKLCWTYCAMKKQSSLTSKVITLAESIVRNLEIKHHFLFIAFSRLRISFYLTVVYFTGLYNTLMFSVIRSATIDRKRRHFISDPHFVQGATETFYSASYCSKVIDVNTYTAENSASQL